MPQTFYVSCLDEIVSLTVSNKHLTENLMMKADDDRGGLI